MRSRLMAVAVLAGALYAVQTPPRAAEKEAALGRQLAAEFRQRNPIIESSAVQTYLDQLGRRIATGLPEGTMPFRFSLTASDSCRATHEPVALPGGYIFVPAALFAEARDENEFAGVLAHAMSHAALHHAMRSAPRTQVSNLASIPLIFLGGGRSCGDELLIPLAYVPILRAQELEADEALCVRWPVRVSIRRHWCNTSSGCGRKRYSVSTVCVLESKACRLPTIPRPATSLRTCNGKYAV